MPAGFRRVAAAALLSLAACGGGSSEGEPPGAPQCTTAAQCPGTDTECRTRTCTAGTCGFSYAPGGTAVSVQIAGDCQENRCDGSGGIAAAALDTDPPADDGNACTAETCVGGAPVHPPLPLDDPCGEGGGAFCDGAGSCVQCNASAQCPGTDTECHSRTCVAGLCGVSDQPFGTTVSTQTDGDCQRSVCDGNGAVGSVALDTDLPVDADPCTSDACTSGVPANPPAAVDTPCNENGGSFCDGAGACVACNAATQCPGSDTECRTRTCSAHGCGVSFAPSGTPCAQDGGTVCSAAGTCVQCLGAADCPGSDAECRSRTCVSNVCGTSFKESGFVVATQTAGDCKESRCDGAGDVVAVALDTDVPDDGKQCTTDACAGGVASHAPLPQDYPCSQGAGSYCDATGGCVPCNTAPQCPAPGECRQATCSAGTCGVQMTPSGTPGSTQVVGDCKLDVCNGTGSIVSTVSDLDVPMDDDACTDDVCTGGLPSNPASPAGTPCGSALACDGTGACVPEIPAVAATSPADGASVVPPSPVAVTFTTAMSPTTLAAQTGVGACSGSIQVSADGFASCAGFASASPSMTGGDTTASLVPAPALLVNRTYQLRVTTASASAAGASLIGTYTSGGFTTANPTCQPGVNTVVISQVYGGGGSSGATYRNDFVELYNRSRVTVDVSNWAVQTTSGTGTGTWTVTTIPAGNTIPPGGYFLVQYAGDGGGTTSLPAPDATGGANLGSTAGKVALTINSTPISGQCPPISTAVADFVGYGVARVTVNCSEGSILGSRAAPEPGDATAIVRPVGCIDASRNSEDFVVAAPAPRSGDSPPFDCACRTVNESGGALEADYCDVQAPPTMFVQTGHPTPFVVGRLFEAGSTEAAGEPGGVLAQLGWGLATINPQDEPGWRWTPAAYAAQDLSFDAYQASVVAPAVGSYRLGFRFSLDAGETWTYCDLDGSGAGGSATFDLQRLPTMIVLP